MLKDERLLTIRNLVDRKGIVTVNEIGESLGVSTMTVRRDLEELADQKELVRIHGGAQSTNFKPLTELSRNEKRSIHVNEKRKIAATIAALIIPGDTIYIGPGTTNEMIAQYLKKTRCAHHHQQSPCFSKLSGSRGFLFTATNWRTASGSIWRIYRQLSKRNASTSHHHESIYQCQRYCGQSYQQC